MNLVHRVMKDFKQLCKPLLYKLENAKINESWEQEFFKTNRNMIETNIDNSDSDTKDNDEPITKTSLHGFTDPHTIFDLQISKLIFHLL